MPPFHKLTSSVPRPGRLHHLDAQLPPPRPLQRAQPAHSEEPFGGGDGEEEAHGASFREGLLS